MNVILAEQILPSGHVVQLVEGDITTEQVDAIVNAANSYLQHGGGVAWIISKCGGPLIQQESDAWVRTHGPVSHDDPAYTSSGSLPCRYVIHAVGPVWGEGDEDRKLAAAVAGSLRRAEELNLTSITFPAISTGIFGFPKERAAGIIFTAIEDYFSKNHSSGIKLTRVILFDQPTLDAFSSIWKDHFPRS
jgi:O-acetyl-ADP-ribose deacetylase (regulator of RNase III)